MREHDCNILDKIVLARKRDLVECLSVLGNYSRLRKLEECTQVAASVPAFLKLISDLSVSETDLWSERSI